MKFIFRPSSVIVLLIGTCMCSEGKVCVLIDISCWKHYENKENYQCISVDNILCEILKHIFCIFQLIAMSVNLMEQLILQRMLGVKWIMTIIRYARTVVYWRILIRKALFRPPLQLVCQILRMPLMGAITSSRFVLVYMTVPDVAFVGLI